MKTRPKRSRRRSEDPRDIRDRIDEELARRIAAWAKLHEVCPLAGCRRNKRCLKPEDCRACSREPLTEEERLALRLQIDAMGESR